MKTFGVIFFLVWGPVTLFFDGLLGICGYKQFKTLGYESAPGVVTRSQYKTYSGPEESSVHADIAFDYEVNGVEYSGDRFSYLQIGGAPASAIVRAAPLGKQVEVFYDPQDPGDSVLQRGFLGRDLFLAFALIPFNIILLMGVVMAAAPFYYRRFRPRAGGVLTLSRGDGVHLRLSRSPITSAAIALIVLSILAALVVGIPTGLNPSTRSVRGAFATVFVLAIAVYVKRRFFIDSNGTDLVVNEREGCLILPRTISRDANERVNFSAITEFEVDDVSIRHSDDTGSVVYEVLACFVDAEGKTRRERLTRWSVRERAELLAAWLSKRVLGRSYGTNAETN